MCLTTSLGGGMISVFSIHTINLSFFKLFVRLYTTVILFFLAFTMVKSSDGIINNSVQGNSFDGIITKGIIQVSNGTNTTNITSSFGQKDNCVVSSTSFQSSLILWTLIVIKHMIAKKF